MRSCANAWHGGGSMNRVKDFFGNAARGFLLCAFLIQVLCGIFYMLYGFSRVPQYSETNVYLQMAETFVMDDYTGIFYPAIVKLCRMFTVVPYQVPIYILQIAAGLFSAYWFLRVWFSGKNAWLCALLLNTIPFVAQMHVAVLPYSLAASGLLVLLRPLLEGSRRKRPLSPSGWGLLVIQGIWLSQLTRGYLPMVAAAFLWGIVLQRHALRGRVAGGFFAAVLLLGVLAGNIYVYRATEVTGAYDRMEHCWQAVLFRRFGYETFEEKYQIYMPEEITEQFDSWEMNYTRLHPYRLDTVIAKELSGHYSRERVHQIYLELGKLGLEVAAKDNLLHLAQDTAAYLFPLGEYFVWNRGTYLSCDSWNYQQFLGDNSRFAAFYIRSCYAVGILLFACSLFYGCFDTWKSGGKKRDTLVGLLSFLLWTALVKAMQGTSVYDYRQATLALMVSYIPIYFMGMKLFTQDRR